MHNALTRQLALAGLLLACFSGTHAATQYTYRTAVMGLMPATAAPATPVVSGSIKNFGAYRSWSDGAYAASCNGYRNPAGGRTYDGDIGDGLYRIQPAGSAFDVYCDMTTDGGGWTLALVEATGTWGTIFTAGSAALSLPVTLSSTTAKLSDAQWAAIPGTATKWTVGASTTFFVRYLSGGVYVPWVTQPWTDVNGGSQTNPQPECTLALTGSWAAGRKYWVSDCWNLTANANTIGLVGSMWDTQNRKAWVR